MLRHASRPALAVTALLALAACQGGALGGSSALPSTGGWAANAPAQPLSLLRAAPHGVRIYVHLPLRNGADLDRLIRAQSSLHSPMYHRFLSVAEFREKYGPSHADLAEAARALERDGFKTTVTSQGVIADATVAIVERTFHIRLSRSARSRFPGNVALLQADKLPTLPIQLARVHARVAAFAPLPESRPNLEFAAKKRIVPQNRYGSDQPFYWFDDLKQAYRYPSVQYVNGSGKTIAVVAASDFLDSDLALYFGEEGLAPPQVIRRPVDGGSPSFNIASGLSDEVSLDVQQAGGSAPGATLMVYEAPDSTFAPSFVDTYTAIDEDNRADVVSTSFGLCELFFLPSYNRGGDLTFLLQLFHDLFRQGNAQGITFVNASGDNGAQGGLCTDVSRRNAIFGVQAMSDDPDVTGVGGTNLRTSSIPNSLQSTYASENAFADEFAAGKGIPNGLLFGSGGGASVIWSKPLYQYLVQTGAAMRSVPDVAMMMGGCPVGAAPPCGAQPRGDRSAFVTALGGGLFLLVGTSGSSPEFAGLQAIQDEVLGGRAGNANFLIYALARATCIGTSPVFHTDIPGNNGYPSHPGYNFVVGNGTPYAAVYTFSPTAPLAGDPQTPSNP